MRVEFIDIKNFRKLKDCRIEFNKETTVFVGANNSGKTSAMDALIFFLSEKKISPQTTDIPICYWEKIVEIGENHTNPETKESDSKADINELKKLTPALDLWLHAEDNELHYVSHLIPTLDWEGGRLGIRIVLEPQNDENLLNSFITTYKNAIEALESRKKQNPKSNFKLWPTSLYDYLSKKNNFKKHFKFKYYILDPTKSENSNQDIAPDLEINEYPLKKLIRVDIINAQRGFSDVNSNESGYNNERKLSQQMKSYYDKNLDYNEFPDESNLEALEAIFDSKEIFNKKLKESFQGPFGELEQMNYPGFNNPKIKIQCEMTPVDSLSHDASVLFDVLDDKNTDENSLNFLPEKYNGLGFQNLISIIFKLISFRDDWMKVGNLRKNTSSEDSHEDHTIEPLHIVLIEEPEAHLHAQVQQVFIRKAYSVLREHDDLKDHTIYSTQLVLSTHSSYIANEVDFTCLRYFKREPTSKETNMPTASVKNLSKTFGDDEATKRFATRYLKTTHCDLFFADVIIMVEGASEKMLLQYFIRNKKKEDGNYMYEYLNRSYISLLELGGSHAHRLRKLLEILGVLTLIITDIDSKDENNNKVKPAKQCKASFKLTEQSFDELLKEAVPAEVINQLKSIKDQVFEDEFKFIQAVKDVIEEEENVSYEVQILKHAQCNFTTRNQTLKDWIPNVAGIKDLIKTEEGEKIYKDIIRVAYQSEIEVNFNDKTVSIIPSTFEDALVLANLDLFKTLNQENGLLGLFVKVIKDKDKDIGEEDLGTALYEALNKNRSKAEMALDLLYLDQIDQLNPPQYIKEGLDWLEEKLKRPINQ